MGVVILILAVLVEIVFAIYCIRLKSSQKKKRNILRILELAIFVLFTVLPVIHWNFKYSVFTGVLFLLALQATVSIIRNKEDKKSYKTSRILKKTFHMSLLLAFAIFPVILMPEFEYLPTTGEYQVEDAAFTYIDKNRIETYSDTGVNRKCNVEFWYPKDAKERYPFIVFSHGSLGVKNSNISMFRELASHGYVVCSIDHPYHSFYTKSENGDVTIVNKGYLNQYLEWASTNDYTKAKTIMDELMDIRKADVNFVIDTVMNKAKAGEDGVYALIDTEKIGVSGHSLGGSVALALGRERDDIGAVLALESPFFGDITDITEKGYIYTDENYPVPMLNIYSDETWKRGTLFEHSAYAQNAKYIKGNYRDSFYAYIRGSNHMTITDLSKAMPLVADLPIWGKNTRNHDEILKIINKASLDFFDCYLKRKDKFVSEGIY